MEEESLDIREYVGVILRRWWLLLLGSLLGGVLAFGFNLSQSSAITPSRAYEATTLLLMEGTGGLGDSSALVETRPVLENVINDLALPLSIEELRAKVSATPISDSRLLEISVKDSDRGFAVGIANGVAGSLIGYIEALRQPQSVAFPQELSEELPDLEPLVAAEVAQGVAEALRSLVQRPSVVAPAEVIQEAGAATGASAIRNVLLGVVFGGVLSVAAVALWEYLQDPVRSPDQMERRFGLTQLGTIPRWQKRRKLPYQLAISNNSDSASSETIRQAATSIEFTAFPREMRILVVASPASGDGRSSLIANLGVALATARRNVVLVDADLRRPSLHHYFDLDNDNNVGLSNFLSDPDMSIADVVQVTSYQRLKIITGGPVPPNRVELLRCPRMGSLLEHLKEAADIVLIDAPPVLTATDGVILASQLEGIIVLVNAASSRMGEIKATLGSLQKVGTPILGFIWNQPIAYPLTEWAFSRQ
jgi:succinoglycan biosynthesis transport protein ExoP